MEKRERSRSPPPQDEKSRGQEDPAASSRVAKEERKGGKRKVQLGTCHLLLLQEVRQADVKSWRGLTKAIKESHGSGEAKSELVESLERLAEQRKASAEALQVEVEKEVARIKQAEEEESQHPRPQDEYMARLEKWNPVKADHSANRLSSARLTRAIESGVGVWLARRQEKSRRRAAAHREQVEQAAASTRADTELSEQEVNKSLDQRMNEAARRELREFRELLRNEETRKPAKRAPDSKRRRKLKKQRQRERKENDRWNRPDQEGTEERLAPGPHPRRNDDTDRDTNHAIAHTSPFESESSAIAIGASPYPGLRTLRPALLTPRDGVCFGVGLLVGTLVWGAARLCLQTTCCRRQPAVKRSPSHPSTTGSSRNPGRERSPIAQSAGRVAVTGAGEAYHKPSCHHVRQRRHRVLRPCRDCLPYGQPSEEEIRRDEAPRRRRNDDSSRDTNHAIAHPREEVTDCMGNCGPSLGWLSLILLSAMIAIACWQTRERPEARFAPGLEDLAASANRRSGSSMDKRRVSFRLPEDQTSSPGDREEIGTFAQHAKHLPGKCEPPFLGGPDTARRLHKGRARPAQPQIQLPDQEAYESATMQAVMDRLTESTRRAYLGQLKWWQLFCRRKGRDWLLSGADSKGEEELLVQYLLHSSVHSKKAPGTLKLRLAAIRSSHVSLGLADPLENKPRLTLVMMGLKKRYGTPVRRAPVTPGMLRWIYPELQKTMPHEYKVVWFSVSLGYYFLLGIRISAG